jgi:hypothetical protein
MAMATLGHKRTDGRTDGRTDTHTRTAHTHTDTHSEFTSIDTPGHGGHTTPLPGHKANWISSLVRPLLCRTCGCCGSKIHNIRVCTAALGRGRCSRRVSRISGSAHLQQQAAHTNTSAGPDARWWWCTTAVPIASMFAPPLGTRVPRSTLINPGAFAVCVGAPGHLDVLPRGVLGYSLAPLNTRVPQNARGNPCRSIKQ